MIHTTRTGSRPVTTTGPDGRTTRDTQPLPRILLAPAVVGEHERELVLDALDSGWIAPVGPHIDRFEQEVADVTGVAHAVAVSSGTAALHLALLLSGVGPGDEVIVPTLTFIASAAPVVHLGATPVFIDVDPGSWTLDPSLLEHELASRVARGPMPRAVVVVDLFGQTADHDRIAEVCARYGVAVVEDAAEGLGAAYRGRPAGSLARMAALSFNGNKIITTSGGGMLLTDDAELARHARQLATHARQPVPHYEHWEVGLNYRMSNLLAAVGRAQLATLSDRVAHRGWVNRAYRHRLGPEVGLTFMPEADWGTSSHWLTVLLVDAERFGATREAIRLHLDRLGIESRPIWKPMHRQPVFNGHRVIGGGVADRLFGEGLCLPSGYGLTPADIDRVADAVCSVPRA